MTATRTRTTTTRDSFLRFALRLDAVVSGVVGVAAAALAPRVADLSGTPVAFEYAMSAFFIVYGVALFALSKRPSVRLTGVVVAIGNVLFTVAAVALVLAGIWPLTTTGIVLTLGTGVFTLVMAELQYQGLRRMKA